MSIKVISQLVFTLLLFVFSTLATWYEGSTILDKPLEWKYTAVFSEIVNGQVETVNEIVVMDYFVYAAKFAPLFPILMLLSGTYISTLIAYIVLKRSGRKFSYLLLTAGSVFLALSGLLADSSASGLKLICLCLLGIGLLAIMMSFFGMFSRGKKELVEDS